MPYAGERQVQEIQWVYYWISLTITHLSPAFRDRRSCGKSAAVRARARSAAAAKLGKLVRRECLGHSGRTRDSKNDCGDCTKHGGIFPGL